MVIPEKIVKYIDKYSVGYRWPLNAGELAGIDSVVVIPVLAEKKRLFKTLSSLSENPQSDFKSTLVLCVINNKSIHQTLPEEIDDNQITLRILKDLVDGKMPDAGLSDDSLYCSLNKILRNNLRVAYVDASSPGCEMPDGSGGVGLARKIGLDLSLRVLDYENSVVKLLFSLDADTLVESNYLRAVRSFFQSKKTQTAVVEFVHRDAPAGQKLKGLRE